MQIKAKMSAVCNVDNSIGSGLFNVTGVLDLNRAVQYAIA